jgi:hypothetical protein
MSKKQQPKQLSPENYIKIKARTLPIDACYINNDWIDSKMANIIILRKHTTGKFTFGIYLVDLLALGTKDTFFNFSQPIQIVDDILSRANFIQIEYNLAHNIIYGGNEFAEEHGFKIHKAFNSVTKYILEPDDDNIPLIEVEFGKDGKPLVII